MAQGKMRSLAGWAACAALWALVAIYAHNHRAFLDQAAPLLK